MTALSGSRDGPDLTPDVVLPFIDEMIWALLKTRQQFAEPGSPMHRDLGGTPPDIELARWLAGEPEGR